MNYHVYTASHGENGRITHFLMDCYGRLSKQEEYPANCPDYMTLENDKLYVLLREPYRGQGGIQTYQILSDGSLEAVDIPEPIRGSIASYVLRHNGYTYVTNYIQGTTIRLPDKMVVHVGSSVHPVRQLCSHPHCIMEVPGTDWLCIADLGTDKVYILDSDLNLLSETVFPAGCGPRHVAFSEDGLIAYCVAEMGSGLFVMKRNGCRYEIVNSYSTLPENNTVESTASAVRISPDGKYVLTTNRGHDSICIYRIDGLELKDPSWIPSGGCSPRETAFIGDYYLVGNEGSDNLMVFDFADGILTQVAEKVCVPSAWAIVGFPVKE